MSTGIVRAGWTLRLALLLPLWLGCHKLQCSSNKATEPGAARGEAALLAVPSEGQGAAAQRERTAALSNDAVLVPTPGCGEPQFGATLAADGDRLLVAATHPTAYDSTIRRAVCLFERSPSGWALSAAFRRADDDPNNPANYDRDYGTALALSGDFLAINTPGTETGDGPVQLFARSDGGWMGPVMVRNPMAPDAEPGDESYWAAALVFAQGQLIVGAPITSTDEALHGALHVFDRASEVQRVRGPPPPSRFGEALAVDEPFLAVSVVEGTRHSVAVYQRGPSRQFALLQRVDSTEPTPRDEFGSAIAMRDGVLVVGATEPALIGQKPGPGRVELFMWDGAQFRHRTTLRAATPQLEGLFGRALAFDGRRLAVGEPARGDSSGKRRVWLYELQGHRVKELGPWVPADLVDADEWFALSLAFGPGWLAAGAPGTPRAVERGHWGRVFVRAW